MGSYYFEDFTVGQQFHSGGRTVTEAEIIGFAHLYDPQAIHIDAEASKDGPFGQLIASGFQTLNVAWWLFLRLGLVLESMYVGVGLEHLRWTRPVRPGDTLSLIVSVKEKGVIRGNKGLVTLHHELFNQNQELVMHYRTLSLILTRESSA